MAIPALADDATGALEAGAKFAHHGLPARIWFWPEQPDTGDLTGSNGAVVDTESRHLAPADAFARICQSASPGVDHLYKKTDSTLRGNITAGFRALMTAYPSRPLVYVPAYPDMGRTGKTRRRTADNTRCQWIKLAASSRRSRQPGVDDKACFMV